MTNPDALAGVVAKLEAFVAEAMSSGIVSNPDVLNQLLRAREASGIFVSRAEARSLLAAFAEAQKERDQLRDGLAEAWAGGATWMTFHRTAERDEIHANNPLRTPQPETPE